MEKSTTSADQDFSAQFLLNRKRRRRRRILAVLVVVAGIGGFYYWQTHRTVEAPEDQQLIATIGYGDIENAIPASGTLQPKEIVPVGARASGELVEIYVEVGDRVKEGQSLALIDPEAQELRVKSSELSLQNQKNQVEQRENALEVAKSNFERTKFLREQNAATPQELENAENALISAQTNLDNLLIQIEQSQTNLDQEKVQLNYTEIKAPLDGTIIEITQKKGATLNATQTAPTVMQIADLSILTVETEISEADISALKAGVPVYFTTLSGDDRRWYGELRQILPMPKNSNNVVLFTGRFDVDNSDGDLYPGMTTQVFFVTSEARNVLTVPIGALTYTDTPTQSGGAEAGAGPGQGGNREEMAARFQEQLANGEITPEMRARIEQFRNGGGRRGGGSGSGAFPGGGFQGGGRGGNFGSAGESDGAPATSSAAPQLSRLLAANRPRNATVKLVQADGTQVTREVVVGAADRVNAQVLSGLVEGDKVIAGVVQAKVEEESNNNNNNRNNNFRGFPGGGGFRPF